MYSEVSMTEGPRFFITLGYYESVIIPEQLESSCLVKEQVAGSSAFDKHGLEAKVECYKAFCDRPGHGIELSGGIPTSGLVHLGIVVLVRRAAVASKGITKANSL